MEATCHKVTGCGWLSVREGTGQGRAGQGSSRRVRDASCTYLQGNGSTARPRQAFGLYGRQSWHYILDMDVSFFGSGHPTHPGKKNGAGGGRDRPLLLPLFTRVERYVYKGTLDEVSQAGTDQTQLAHMYSCTNYDSSDYCQVSNVLRVERKDEKPGRPQHRPTTTLPNVHTHIQYLTRAVHVTYPNDTMQSAQGRSRSVLPRLLLAIWLPQYEMQRGVSRRDDKKRKKK